MCLHSWSQPMASNQFHTLTSGSNQKYCFRFLFQYSSCGSRLQFEINKFNYSVAFLYYPIYKARNLNEIGTSRRDISRWLLAYCARQPLYVEYHACVRVQYQPFKMTMGSIQDNSVGAYMCVGSRVQANANGSRWSDNENGSFTRRPKKWLQISASLVAFAMCIVRTIGSDAWTHRNGTVKRRPGVSDSTSAFEICHVRLQAQLTKSRRYIWNEVNGSLYELLIIIRIIF